MAPTIDTLNDLYSDTKTCAKLVGLEYVENELEGIRRKRHGKGFSYHNKSKVVSERLKARITELVIPPAWQEVWICPADNGHVLATGIDEKGRKQYIYHPKWRTMRDLIKFYRMIVFATALPSIRKDIDKHLGGKAMSREHVMATMLWILDNSYIRIGNDVYFNSNESVGLTTMTDENVAIAGNVVTLNFIGKSGKQQQITFENPKVAATLKELKKVRGARLFRYKDSAGKWQVLDSTAINNYLHELTELSISAKDFRTWGGTLMAFLHLIDEYESNESKKTEKVVIEAIDSAAAVLGNTRTVARASYVHPHILATYSSKDFGVHYKQANKQRKAIGLDKHETELQYFLKQLFETEFDLLKKSS